MNIVHVIVNNLGGITSLVQNLILYKGNEALPQEVIVLDIKTNPNEKAILDFEVTQLTRKFSLDPINNWYSIYSEMAKMLSESSGVLVSNDQYDLIMLQAFNIPRKVVQLVHDPYNVELSLKFHEVIDHFITHSQYIFEKLRSKIPHREDDITFLPYGIPLCDPVERKLNANKPLQLVFLGRHDRAKGVYDLFEIDNLLRKKDIQVNWLILGKGPESVALHKQWERCNNVEFDTPISNSELMKKLAQSDIMVFPTKFEGFPVALLECMSVGCVPVVTDLPGGIQELVLNGETGFRCEIDNNHQFANAIELLNHDRSELLRIQKLCTNKVHYNHDAKVQAPTYQKLFNVLARSSRVPLHHFIDKKIGSRLDHPFIPNSIVRSIRQWIN